MLTIQQIVERHNIQSQWLENFILAYVAHLYYHSGPEWGELDTEDGLAKLIITHPFEHV